MVNGKKLLASVLVGAMVVTGSPVATPWSVTRVEAATSHSGDCSFDGVTPTFSGNSGNKTAEQRCRTYYWNDYGRYVQCEKTRPLTVVTTVEEPTCTQPGQRVYEAYYGQIKQGTSTEPIPATGHSYSSIKFEKNEDGEVEAYRVCSKCDDKVNYFVKSEIATQPDCTQTGERVYKAYESENSDLALDTWNEKEVVDATGHDYGDVVFNKENDQVEAYRVCSKCDDKVNCVVIPEITKEATCTAPGEKVYKAYDPDTDDYLDTWKNEKGEVVKDVVKKLDHQTEETAYWTGVTSVRVKTECKICKTVTKEEVSDKVVLEVDPNNKPTCTKEGKKVYVAYVKNGFDKDKVQLYREIARKASDVTVPKVAHDYSASTTSESAWHIVRNGRDSYTGTIELECGYGCGEKYTETITVNKTELDPINCKKYIVYKPVVVANNGKTYKYPGDGIKDDLTETVDVHTGRLEYVALKWNGNLSEGQGGTIHKTGEVQGKLSYDIIAYCADCIDENDDPTEYILDTVVVHPNATESKAATCTEDAVEVYDAQSYEYTASLGTGMSLKLTATLPKCTVVYDDSALDHKLEGFTNNTCKTVTERGTCTVCGKEGVTQTIEGNPKYHKLAPGASEIKVPATCTEGEKIVYTKCSECYADMKASEDEYDGDTSPYSVVVSEGNPLGHDYIVRVNNNGVPADKIGLEKLVCERNDCDCIISINKQVDITKIIVKNAENCQKPLTYVIPKDVINDDSIKNDVTATVYEKVGSQYKATYGEHNFEVTHKWSDNIENPSVAITYTCTNKDANGRACTANNHTYYLAGNDIVPVKDKKASCAEEGYKVVKATFDGNKELGHAKYVVPETTFAIPKSTHRFVEPTNAKVTCDWEKEEIYIPCRECTYVETVKANDKDVKTYVDRQEISVKFDNKTYSATRKIGNINNEFTVITLPTKFDKDVVYTGKAYDPTTDKDFVVTYKGTTVLKKGFDYTVEVKDNVNVGTATITITGIGAYYGTATKTFKIKKATLEAVFDDKSLAKVYGDKDSMSYALTNKDTKEVATDADVKAVLTREEGENVGSYTYTLKVAESANYEAYEAKGVFVIRPREAVIAIQNASKVVGKADPKFIHTTENVVPGDDLNVTITREQGETLGEYVIHATFNNPNYNVNVKTAVLTIKEATTVTPSKPVTPAPKAQSITTTKLSATYKVATVKKAAKYFSIAPKAKTTVTAKKVSGSKKITVTSTGKVKIAKGTKKGTYKATVKLSAKASNSYKAATKTVKVTVKVK